MSDARERPDAAIDAWLEAWVREHDAEPCNGECDVAGAKAILSYIAEVEAQRDAAFELLLSWHMSHGYKDDRSRADSFADCESTLCVSARALLSEQPK